MDCVGATNRTSRGGVPRDPGFGIRTDTGFQRGYYNAPKQLHVGVFTVTSSKAPVSLYSRLELLDRTRDRGLNSFSVTWYSPAE